MIVVPDQQLFFQDILLLDDTICGFQPEILADSWIQFFGIVRRILSTFGKDLNMFHPSTEIDMDLTVFAVVLPFHIHAS